MEFVFLSILIAALVLRSIRLKKDKEQFNNLTEIEKQKILKEEQNKKQQADELITVILPTLKNGKYFRIGYDSKDVLTYLLIV